jgi:AbrB family looped-hinge helix DNA binding protein
MRLRDRSKAMERQFFSKVDSHGRITIPAVLRRALRLRPGTRVVFTPMPGYILVETRVAWLRRLRLHLPPPRPKGLAQRLR